jgi:hypothetical protein
MHPSNLTKARRRDLLDLATDLRAYANSTTQNCAMFDRRQRSMHALRIQYRRSVLAYEPFLKGRMIRGRSENFSQVPSRL